MSVSGTLLKVKARVRVGLRISVRAPGSQQKYCRMSVPGVGFKVRGTDRVRVRVRAQAPGQPQRR